MSAAALPTTPAAGRLDDFPDWLSPILVKELRQGMRTRIFVGSFILLQIAMVFLALFAMSSAADGSDTEAFSVVFWMIVGVPLLLAMPASALGAIGAERRGNTLELVFLTRLSARRILFGKWVAIVVQSALLVCAVVPYLVLRYFLGGIDLSFELQWLFGMLVASVVFTGIAAALSCLPRRVMIALVILCIIGIFAAMAGVAGMRMAMAFGAIGSGGFGGVLLAWVAGIVLNVIFLLVLLEFGANQFAPLSENHSTPIRLLALACLPLVLVFGLINKNLGMLFFAGANQIIGLVLLGLMMEAPRFLPGIYAPFVRFGALGRIAGRFLYPGWPSATLFACVIVTLDALLTARYTSPLLGDQRLFALGANLGALLFPMAIVRLFWPEARRPLAGWLLVHVGVLLLFAIALLVQAFDRHANLHRVFSFVPSYAIFWVPSSDPLHPAQWRDRFMPALICTGLSLLVLIWRSLKPWRQISAAERQAQARLKSGTPTAAASQAEA